jgi:hypothetical protein
MGWLQILGDLMPAMRVGVCKNLISVSCLNDHGFDVYFLSRGGHIEKNGKIVARIHREKNLFYLTEEVDQVLNVEKGQPDYPEGGPQDDWHYRLGHISKAKLKQLALPSLLSYCESCDKGKMKFHKHRRVKGKLRKLLKLQSVNADGIGPLPVGINQERYLLVFIDEATRYLIVEAATDRSEFANIIKRIMKTEQKRFRLGILQLQTDGAKEFITIKPFLDEENIIHRVTIPYDHASNGIVERANQSIMETTRCLIHHANLPIQWWPYAAKYASHIYNVTPHDTLGGLSPHEAYHEEKPRYNKFWTFGTKVQYFIPDELRTTKVDARAKPGLFMGICDTGCLVYSFEKRQVIITNTLNGGGKFLSELEREDLGLDGYEPPQRTSDPDWIPPTSIDDQNESSKSEKPIKCKDKSERQKQESSASEGIECQKSQNSASEGSTDCSPSEGNGTELSQIFPKTRRSRQTRSLNTDEKIAKLLHRDYERDLDRTLGLFTESLLLADQTDLACIDNFIQDNPTWQEILAGPQNERLKWEEAIQTELEVLTKNGTWENIDPNTNVQSNKQILNSKFIFKIKRDQNGNVIKYKARLVAQGFNHFAEHTFSPVGSKTSLRMLLAISARNGYKLRQLDIEGAYLYGKIDEEIYLKVNG